MPADVDDELASETTAPRLSADREIRLPAAERTN